MSTYEYKCEDNHSYIEERPMGSDQVITLCPVCSKSLKRVFTSNPVLFKGSGFYSSRG
jgi:putative FmdB family regulatory protein